MGLSPARECPHLTVPLIPLYIAQIPSGIDPHTHYFPDVPVFPESPIAFGTLIRDAANLFNRYVKPIPVIGIAIIGCFPIF